MRRVFFLLLLLFLLTAQAPEQQTIPAGAISDARYALGYLVCNYYSGVDKTGSADATAGLNQCISDAYQGQLVSYLECGNPNYKTTDTLVFYEWANWVGGKAEPNSPSSHAWRGQSGCAGGNWPEIKLASSAPLFDGSPRPMVAFRSFIAESACAVPNQPPPDPLGDPACFKPKDNGGNYFGESFAQTHLNTNGHSGAMGIAMAVAQDSFLRDVKVTATGSVACFYGTPGRGYPAVKLECIGGQYGIYTPTPGGNFDSTGPVIVGAKLTNQTVRAIKVQEVTPPIFVGFEITKSSDGPAIETPYEAAFIDGKITMSGAAANDDVFSNAQGHSLYLRNNWVNGSLNLVRSNTGALERLTTASAGPWVRIQEYVYNDPAQYDGNATASSYPTYTICGTCNPHLEARAFIAASGAAGVLSGNDLPRVVVVPNAGTPPTDLMTRHLWTTYPSFEDGTYIMPVCDTYQGTDPQSGNSKNDCTSTIQTAINNAAIAGHNRVHLPRGWSYLTGSLTLKADTHLMAAAPYKGGLSWRNTWAPTSGTGAVPMLITEDNAAATTSVSDMSLHIRTAPTTNDYMYYLRWRAGKNSQIFGVTETSEFIACNTTTGLPTNNARNANWFSNNGGGKIYGLAALAQKWIDRNTATRQNFIDGTTQPLTFYGANAEFGKGGACGVAGVNHEVNGASNVRFFGSKQEGNAGTLRVTNSQNVLFVGAGQKVDAPGPANALIEVTGTSDNVTMGLGHIFGNPQGQPNGKMVLRDAVNGVTAQSVIPWPTRLAYYTRGQADDAPFATAGTPSVTAPTLSSVRVDVASQIEVCWQRFDSADMTPAPPTSATGFTVTVAGSGQTPTSVLRQGSDCFLLTFAPGTITVGTQAVVVSYSGGNIASGGSGTPAATAFSSVTAINTLTPTPPPILTQTGFAFRSLYGLEDAITSPFYIDETGTYENQNVRFILGAQFRLRFRVVNTNADAGPRAFYACYDKELTGTYVLLPETCSASDTCFTDAPGIGDMQPTTQQLTPTPSMTWVPGVFLKHATSQAILTLPQNSETEIEFPIQMSLTAPNQARYTYRLCEAGGTPLTAYTVTPQNTVVSLRSSHSGGGNQ